MCPCSYLKYDACLYNLGVTPRARYQAMGRALNVGHVPALYVIFWLDFLARFSPFGLRVAMSALSV